MANEFLNILSEVDIPLIATDKDVKLIFANDYALELFSLKLGKSSKPFYKSIKFYREGNVEIDQEQLPFITAIKNKSSVSNYKLKHSDLNGTVRWFNANSLYISAIDKQPEFVLLRFGILHKQNRLKIGLQKLRIILAQYYIHLMPTVKI